MRAGDGLDRFRSVSLRTRHWWFRCCVAACLSVGLVRRVPQPKQRELAELSVAIADYERLVR